ncbi:DUF1007 family protein [Sulfitobacter noctilucae]|uniref:DUF1007 family protein n=1 Tax=Sulfitobacter noctilucae TaxID=1342302 RepID=UPI001F4CC260|nr:DUF1007 family protein [Sulfitobacter noctilucae]
MIYLNVMKHALSLILLVLSALPLTAHPHIFVDTGLDLRFDDQNRLIEVRMTWAYDDLYSLLITEDRGLDPDFDGVLTEAEQADLQGFDMNWSEGFNGDLVILQDGAPLALSGPMQATAVYADGRITTTHVRRVSGAEEAGVIEVKPYDKTYYTAYDITLPVQIEGSDACGKRIEVPDVAAGLAAMGDQLNQMDAFMTDEEWAAMPDLGVLLTSTVVVTCDIS